MMPIENLRELSERLVACKHFYWMLGMRAVGPMPFGYTARIFHPNDGIEASKYKCSPDLSDAATIGCLIQILKEKWNEPALYLHPRMNGDDITSWRITLPSSKYGRSYMATTAEEAIVLAFEALDEYRND